MLARLENTRLGPGLVAEALDIWEEFVREPYHRLYDPKYEAGGCGCWGCCTPMFDVLQVLIIAERALPKRDARRLRRRLDRLDDLW